jgi:hypothetical protein
MIEGSRMDLTSALALARARGTGEIWQQIVDDRGRPIGDLFRLTGVTTQASASQP